MFDISRASVTFYDSQTKKPLANADSLLIAIFTLPTLCKLFKLVRHIKLKWFFLGGLHSKPLAPGPILTFPLPIRTSRTV
jgi:hypothetical protein